MPRGQDIECWAKSNKCVRVLLYCHHKKWSVDGYPEVGQGKVRRMAATPFPPLQPKPNFGNITNEAILFVPQSRVFCWEVTVMGDITERKCFTVSAE